jgi:hypothetical protein
MMKKGKRNVYDPTIVSRLADEHNASPSADEGELYFTSDVDRSGLNYVDGYMTETEETSERQLTSEILDPKLHDLSVRGRSQQAKARRRRCLLLTSLMVTLAVVIAVICGVTVQKNKSAPSSSSAVSEQQNLNQVKDGVPDHAVLPTPPANLKEICTGAADAASSLDTSTLAQCKAACEPAKCCDVPSQFKSSCLRGNEDVCMQYHQECFVLELQTYGSNENDPFVLYSSNVTVQPAPDNLEATCAMNMLTSNAGADACSKLCKPYTCCFSPDVLSCADQDLCAGYSPCMNLRAHTTLDATIEKEVNQLCGFSKLQTSVENRQQCNNACKLARCCFNDGCFAKPDGFCRQYNSCKNLYGKKADKLKPIDDATYDDQYDDDDGTYDGKDGTDYAGW